MRAGGTVTAGNASASNGGARTLQLAPAGFAPQVMGRGVIAVNETFAAQALTVLRLLDLRGGDERANA